MIRTFASLATALLTTLVLAPAAGAGDPVPPATTTVTGRVDAVGVRDLALCARACVDDGLDSEEGIHPATLDGAGGFEVTAPADGYRIAFRGRVSPDGPAVVSGYLRRHRSGAYTLVDAFSRGTAVTLEEGTALDLGRLAVRAPAGGRLDGWGTLHIIGDTWAYADITAHRIPRGTTIVVRSYGCGEPRTRQVVRRAGSFTFEWDDPHANRHYSRSLELRAVLRKPGHLDRHLRLVSWSIPRSYGWRCR